MTFRSLHDLMSDLQESDKPISEMVSQDSKVRLVDKYVYNTKMSEKLNYMPFCCLFVRCPKRIYYTGLETLKVRSVLT
jgi:hypothetical protein